MLSYPLQVLALSNESPQYTHRWGSTSTVAGIEEEICRGNPTVSAQVVLLKFRPHTGRQGEY